MRVLAESDANTVSRTQCRRAAVQGQRLPLFVLAIIAATTAAAASSSEPAPVSIRAVLAPSQHSQSARDVDKEADQVLVHYEGHKHKHKRKHGEWIPEVSKRIRGSQAAALKAWNAVAAPSSPLPRRPPRFVLSSPSFAVYRLLGNDMWPLQGVGQLRRNTAFAVKNEVAAPANVGVYWIVNRIVNATERALLVSTLKHLGIGDEQILYVDPPLAGMHCLDS